MRLENRRHEMPKAEINFLPTNYGICCSSVCFSSMIQMLSYGSARLIPRQGVTSCGCDLSSRRSFTLESLCAE